jgi:hypothetical protein
MSDEALNALDRPHEIRAIPDPIAVLVKNDHSPYRASDFFAKAARICPRLLSRQQELGLDSAYLAPFRFALEPGYDCSVSKDCDCCDNPRYLRNVLCVMEQDDPLIGLKRQRPLAPTPVLRSVSSHDGRKVS